MLTKEPPPPHSFDAGSMSLVPGLLKGLGVCSCIVGDMPAARYRERVIGESQEAIEAGDSKDHLDPLPSVHVAEERALSSPVPRPQPMSDASRLWSFGGRTSDIPNFLGLDNPVTGCQIGSILETSPNYVCQVRYEMGLIKRGSY